jgi:hypothetical protein
LYNAWLLLLLLLWQHTPLWLNQNGVIILSSSKNSSTIAASVTAAANVTTAAASVTAATALPFLSWLPQLHSLLSSSSSSSSSSMGLCRGPQCQPLLLQRHCCQRCHDS